VMLVNYYLDNNIRNEESQDRIRISEHGKDTIFYSPKSIISKNKNYVINF